MKHQRMITSLLVSLACLPQPLLGHGHHHHDHDHEEFTWTEEKSAYADVDLAVAGGGKLQNYSQIAGQITLHPDHYAYGVCQGGGCVIEVRKNVGDVVRKGEVMATFESEEVALVKADYLKSLKRVGYQKLILQKEGALRGISPGRDYLTAEVAYEEAEIEKGALIEKLQVMGFTEEEIARIPAESPSKLRVYTLKSPMDGKILDRNLTVGERVESGTPAFKVANFEKVWVQMRIPQNDVQYLKEGGAVEIQGVQGKRESVTICQFDPTICEQTRKARAIAMIGNQEGKWTPGEYVTVNLQTTTSEAPVVVAKEAVQKIKGEAVLFVQQECGNFAPCPVKLGREDREHVEVISGLKVGETYVSRNAFALKADFQKEEIEHNH